MKYFEIIFKGNGKQFWEDCVTLLPVVYLFSKLRVHVMNIIMKLKYMAKYIDLKLEIIAVVQTKQEILSVIFIPRRQECVNYIRQVPHQHYEVYID